MAEREGDDAFFEEERQLIPHARWSSSARTQDLQAVALDERLLAVVGRVMYAELAAGAVHADFLCAGEQANTVAEEQVMHWSRKRSSSGVVKNQKDGPLSLSAA